MITLNDYLYSGDTVLKILKKYTEDLRQSAAQTGNEVDVRHCEFLSQIMELLEHNDFLTAGILPRYGWRRSPDLHPVPPAPQ